MVAVFKRKLVCATSLILLCVMYIHLSSTTFSYVHTSSPYVHIHVYIKLNLAID